MLKKHTEMNERHSCNAALVEQIQALTATHQQLATQMQALINVVSDQCVPAKAGDSASSFMIAAAVALCVALGILIARFLM